jgi:APA family basic amino acid/polyamine antiporter
LIALNLYGIKQRIKLDIILVSLTIMGLLVVIFSGFSTIGTVNVLEVPSLSGVLSAAALIFFAFLGFEDIANLGEEAKNPRKTLPLALIISLIVCVILYVLVAIVSVNVVPWQKLAESPAPLSLVAGTELGPGGANLLSVLALFATASTVLGFFLAYSRMVYGMSEEKVFPPFFRKLSKAQVPYFSIIIIGVVAALFVVFSDIVTVASLTDFGALFVFIMVNISLIVLRYTEPFSARKFIVPGSIGKFPVIPAIGTLLCFALLMHFSLKIWVYSTLLFSLGILMYYVFNRKKRKGPYGVV